MKKEDRDDLLSRDRNILMTFFYKGKETGSVMICEGSFDFQRFWYARVAGIKKFDDYSLSVPNNPDKKRFLFSSWNNIHLSFERKRMDYLSRHNNFVHTIK